MSPEFEEGEIVVIEPGAYCEDGSYVIALHEEEYIFRRLSVKEDKLLLHPVNPSYPDIELSDRLAIKGKVVSKAGQDRQRKSYL